MQDSFDQNAGTAGDPKCRHCETPLFTIVADLGATPIANDYLDISTVSGAEPFYPLRAYVCSNCRLVQLRDFKRASELFDEDYAYFSSVSSTWVDHARRYADAMIDRFHLTAASTVVEVASNDGYLLQFFKAKGTKILGVEPSRSVANYAIKERDIPSLIAFFGRNLGERLAREGLSADLTAANNVLAHVPDINDFVSGFRELLKPHGVSTFEFPHLLNLIHHKQFDTIYHEHFSYISLIAAERIFRTNGMRVFDVEEIPTHGGSLRLYACRAEAHWPESPRVAGLIGKERTAGLATDAVYQSFAENVRETKRALLTLLIALKRAGKTIAGYGAPAKGNTLLNYCGIGADILEFTVDLSPQKQGLYLPGTRLPIRAPVDIDATKPDYVLILPWNIKQEIIAQMAHIRSWGGKFIVPIPVPEIID